MANPFITFLKAFGGRRKSEETSEDIKKAAQAGEMAAKKVADTMGFIEQVDIDAEKARKKARAKTDVKEDAQKDGR